MEKSTRISGYPEEPTPAEQGADCVDGYFSCDFIHDEHATPGMVNGNVASVKKLYRFMCKTGRVPQKDYDELLDGIRAFKPGWLQLACYYQARCAVQSGLWLGAAAICKY